MTLKDRLRLIRDIIYAFSFKDLADWLRFRLKQNTKTEQKTVFFDLASMDSCKRTPVQIIRQFHFAGYQCFFSVCPTQYLLMDKYAKSITILENTFFSKGKSDFSAVVSGSEKFLRLRTEQLKIRFNRCLFDNLNNIDTKDFFYPFLLHPNLYFPETENNCKTALCKNIDNSRSIAVLFCGNVNNALKLNNTVNVPYNFDDTRKYFQVLTRMDIFLFIANNLHEHVFIPASFDELITEMQQAKLIDKIVLIDTMQTVIPQNRLLEIMRQAEFFIHTPGFNQPYCHIHVESMLAGCIPVTQLNRYYLNLFQNQENALLFNSLDDLKFTLLAICSRQQTIKNNPAKMRKNIMSIYDNIFSIKSFFNRLSNIEKSAPMQVDYWFPPDEVPREWRDRAIHE
jgi:hypothetical protein